MKNRSQFLTGFLAGRGYYYQVALRERAEKSGHFIEIVFFPFDDHDHKNKIGGLKFSVPKGTKPGDDGTLLVIAETIVRRLNTTRIPHRPSIIPVVWGARIIQIVREIMGIGVKADANPIERLKEIANICGFFAQEGPDGPVDDTVPPFIAEPMAHWRQLQAGEGDVDDGEPIMPTPGNPKAEAKMAELIHTLVPFVAEVQMIGETLQLFWPGHTCTWPVGRDQPVFASAEVEAAWYAARDAYIAEHPDYGVVLGWAEQQAEAHKLPKAGAITIVGQVRDALESGIPTVAFVSGPTDIEEVAIPDDVLAAARTAIKHTVPPAAKPENKELIERVSALPYVVEANEAMQTARTALDEAERAGKGERELQALHDAYVAAIEAVGVARRRGEIELTAQPCEGFVVDDATGEKSGCDSQGDDCPVCGDAGVEAP